MRHRQTNFGQRIHDLFSFEWFEKPSVDDTVSHVAHHLCLTTTGHGHSLGMGVVFFYQACQMVSIKHGHLKIGKEQMTGNTGKI